ncbi:selenocysteine lyase isoform X1 [Colius striatus]|uniref:selenocysteine lyase isoform X1 n=1 Tax=Colius striatus TaxID=57412 RepID=UPI002B1CF31A|nr:selenocysteine lyase isoform X1 [Colius striatus]
MGGGTEPAELPAHASEGTLYLDYNATTPLAPEAAQAVRDAVSSAWGNPSSSHPAGRKARELIHRARESLARMVGGRTEDIVFTSGGTEANNMVIHTACRHFHQSQAGLGHGQGTPHIVTSSVEHDSIRLPLEQMLKESLAEVSFVAVSPRSGRAEVDDVLAAIRPTTCLVSIMLANNETGVIMPVAELSQHVRALNQRRAAEGLPRILLHTDAAQMIGKGRVDVQELGVDYLTIVGHKFYGPRIGALYVCGPGSTTPLHPLLFGGGQERSFRPGTENTPMIAGLGQAAELVSKNWEAYEAQMRDVRDYLEARLEDRSARKPRVAHSPLGFLRPPLGSRRSTSTATLRAPSDSATPVISPSWAQAFKAVLHPSELRDPSRRGTERPAAERGPRHHPRPRGPGGAGPRAGCGAAGTRPCPVDPRSHSPAITQQQSSHYQLHKEAELWGGHVASAEKPCPPSLPGPCSDTDTGGHVSVWAWSVAGA